MAEAAKGGLVSAFTKVAKHILSPTMLIMMAAMALPAVAAAVPAGSLTLGDWGLSTLDHYISMFKAPFTQAGAIGDVFSNAASGKFAGAYELGSQTAHTAHAATTTTAATAGAHAGHTVACAPFESWQSGLSATDLATMQGDAATYGQSLPQYYQNNFCMKHS